MAFDVVGEQCGNTSIRTCWNVTDSNFIWKMFQFWSFRRNQFGDDDNPHEILTWRDQNQRVKLIIWGFLCRVHTDPCLKYARKKHFNQLVRRVMEETKTLEKRASTNHLYRSAKRVEWIANDAVSYLSVSTPASNFFLKKKIAVNVNKINEE